MKRLWRWMVDFSSRRENGTSFAAFRILVSLTLLYSLLSIASADLVDALWVDRIHGGMQVVHENHLMRLLGGATPDVVWFLWTLSLLSTLTLLVGAFGRVSAFVLLQSYYALYITNGLATGGYDMMISNALWLLVLGDSTATLSIDCWRRHRSFTSDDLVAAWPRYALVWQLTMVYFFTGIQKASAPWTPGGGYTALYYVMHDPTFMRFDGSELATSILPLTQIGTAVSWHWEHSAILLPLIFYFRASRDRPGRIRKAFNRFDLRKVWAAIGVAMHLGILFMLNVGPFSLISMSYYVSLFAPDEVRSVLARAWPARFSAAADR
jgi:hypothetical protein